MTAFSERLQEHIIDLAWSLWAELGVSGWRRRHMSHSIDPEPLILFTSLLGDTDPRLRDESTDWCIAYGRYISAARLKTFLVRESPEAQKAFGEFAATVNAHSTLRWPGATKPRRYQRTGRSEVSDFRRASLIALRLRALFGVGARAEILRAFLAEPATMLSAAELAGDAGYTKRNIAEALDALRMAGVLETIPVRNQLRYRLDRPGELKALVGELPSSFPRWRSIFRILEVLLQTARKVGPLTPTVRAVEVTRTLHEVEPDLRLVRVRPPLPPGERDAWNLFEHWALQLAEHWARGILGAPSSGRKRAAS